MSSERKVAVITGASRGIGASLVEGFHKLGYGVVANSRTIGKAGLNPDAQTVLVEGDIAAPATSSRILSAALERFGRVDTLVNNAGVFIPKPFVDYSEADFDVVATRFLNAVQAMEQDGWFWTDPVTTNKSVKRSIMKEMIGHRFGAARDHRSCEQIR